MNSDDMGVSLAELQDFEQDGAHISESVMNFLDKEWIKQDIHRQLGEKCKEVYIKGRKEGVLDLGDMLIALGSALEVFDMKDAYVGAWDVANTGTSTGECTRQVKWRLLLSPPERGDT